MTDANAPLAHPVNSQYDPDSAPNQPYNCGPATVTNVIRCQNGRDYGIEATRNLATSRDGNGTTLAERKVMFERRSVPAEVIHPSYADLKKLLDGSRTCEVALLMSKIPLTYRKTSFGGSHSVELLSNAVKNGVSGVYINDPNHHKSRGDSGRRFVPDTYMKAAYEAMGRWGTRPTKARVIPSRTSYVRKFRTTAGVNLRTGPGTGYKSVKVVAAGYAFTSRQLETKGGAYTAGGRTRTDWLSFSLNGQLVWVARGYTREV